MGAHTTSDDPTKYRGSAEVEPVAAQGPDRPAGEVPPGTRASPTTTFFERVRAEATSSPPRPRGRPRPRPRTSGPRSTTSTSRPTRWWPRAAGFEEYSAGFADEEAAADRRHRRQYPLWRNRKSRRRPTDDHHDHCQGHQRGPAGHAGERPQRRCSWARTSAALGGVFRVTDGLQADFGEDRVIDTPLAESGIVGTAIGLALRGYRPVCEIQFDGFVYPAFDQIVSQLAKMHSRSDGNLTVPVVIRIPFGGGIGAVEHHSESPEALFAHTAGLRVVTPSNPHDAYWMIQQAIDCDDPVIVFEPKRRYWDKGEVDTETPGASADPFKAHVLREGTDVTLVVYGPMVPVALDAAEAAAEEGHSVEVIDLRSLSPLDFDTVTASVQKTGRLVVVHEAPTFRGIGAEIAARISERCFYSLEAPVIRVGGFHMPYPVAKVEEDYLPDLDRILEAVDRALAY